ncbi:class I glutamine amidotransferase-like protein [Aspergillus granulosus]|uniref:D-lactate dehydratase n=1 Tax=Aspergillus granulosus TaxID=176169 RepID=A0ABR4GXP9_9EURO
MSDKPKRILHVVTNTGHYDDSARKQSIASPAGGRSPLEPRSLKFPNTDKSAKAWQANPVRMALLENTVSPEQVDSAEFDAIYVTGGHGVMYDIPDSEGLQRITREIFERGGIVASVCHGYCGLLNTKLSDGSYLVAGREMTGFSWKEEVLARVNKLVPYNAEEEVKKRGPRYQKRERN